MRRLMLVALGLGAALPAAAPGQALPPAAAVPTVVSPAPDTVSVTVYRDPNRRGGRVDPRWLQGYALISEKRRVHVPQGASVLRFEGVADGMIAVSAVVSGLPGGVDEKNRDAQLLSPAALLNGTLGNRVHIRRTDRATGAVTETDAIIRSDARHAVVLQTAQGVEALRCSGLPETLVYDSIPEGLSAKPTFTVRTSAPQETDAEVTLTYLATGFDWSAHYVATLEEGGAANGPGAGGGGDTLDLFAWLTVANGNGAAYPGAQLLAVAGEPHRTSDFSALSARPDAPGLSLSCWPMDGTSTRPEPAPLPPAPPAPMAMAAPLELAVTARRMDKAMIGMMAEQEDLGDLKLYRVPQPVDILPSAQKQVALLHREKVPVRRFYKAIFVPDDEESGSRPTRTMLRFRNLRSDGLGLPLPSGGVALLAAGRGDAQLIGQDELTDKAVGEEVELAAGESDPVRLGVETLSVAGGKRRVRLTLTNATARAAPVEVTLPGTGDARPQASARLATKNGARLWAVTVPPRGRVTLDLRYKITD